MIGSVIDEITIEIVIDSIRYWLVCKTYNDNIIHIEFHKNEVCELFLHSELVLNAYSKKELEDSDYFDLIHWILKHNTKLSTYKVFSKK